MEVKYQLQPIDLNEGDKHIERVVYVIARCLSASGFTIDSRIYEQLTESEKVLFKSQAHL